MKSLVLKIVDHTDRIYFSKNYFVQNFSKSNKMTTINFRKDLSFKKVINSSCIGFKIDKGKSKRTGYLLEMNAASISTP